MEASHPARLCRWDSTDIKPAGSRYDRGISGGKSIRSTLIERVTIYPAGEHGSDTEVVARVCDLMTFVTNDNSAPRGACV